MKRRVPRRNFRALDLNESERLRLSAFVVNNRDWVARHAVSLEIVLRKSLRQLGMELIYLQQVVPHPVYELSLRLGAGSPATRPEIERAVRMAFATAARSVNPQFAQAVIRRNRAKVVVYVEGWIHR